MIDVWLLDGLLLIGAYLLGSISGSLSLGALRGIDIRKHGSGNAGGTNALRTQGWKFALGTIAIDIDKAVLGVFLVLQFGSVEWLKWPAVLLLMGGHVWPIFHGFRGGKAAATLVGGLLLAWPAGLAGLLLVWLLVLVLSGYVSLATVLAAGFLVPLAISTANEFAIAFSVVAASFIFWAHRQNVQRLIAGSENRFERVQIFRRLWHRLRR